MSILKVSKKYKYNLLLINPKQDFIHFGTQIEMTKLLGKKTPNTTLALPIIAALTPDYYNICIVDEMINDIPESFKPDLVGISTYLASSERAFKISKKYRDQGIPVVFGGPFVTYEKEKGMPHATSVVIGEAEGLWEKVIVDFENGNLQKVYESATKIDFKSNVIPRWDLIDTSQIISVSIQTRRGCPYMCEFCLVSQMFGRKVRYRNIDNIIEELEALPIKRVIFVDDNFITNKKYTLRLLERMKPLGLSWMCQASVDVGKDEELLQAMADAGCNFIILGFESVNPESIKETHKHQNTTVEYKEVIHNIHKLGMIAYGSFIIGFDHDTDKEFENIYKFSKEAELPYTMVSILGAIPGTELYTRLCEEGRWVPDNKEYSGGMFPVMHYNNFSQKEIFEKYISMMEKIYSFNEIYDRTVNMLSKGYFTKVNKANPASFGLKFRTSMLVIREYLLSKDPDRKKFFLAIWKLYRQKKLAMDTAAPVLLAMLGVHIHFKKIRANMDHYMDIIGKADKGSWKDQQKSQKQNVA